MNEIANEEIFQLIKDSGYGEVLDIILNEPMLFSRSGRLKKSRLARILNVKIYHLEMILEDIKNIVRAGSLHVNPITSPHVQHPDKQDNSNHPKQSLYSWTENVTRHQE